MDAMKRLLLEAGFLIEQWGPQSWVHENVHRMPYWQGGDPHTAYTSLVIPDVKDHGACQLEEAAFLYGLVRVFKPKFVVETGCNIGLSTSALMLGLRDNGRGFLWTCDLEQRWVDETDRRLRLANPLPSFVTHKAICDKGETVCRQFAALDKCSMFFHDSLHTEENVLAEFNAIKGCMPIGAISLFHDAHVVWDAGTTLDEMRRTIARICAENPNWSPFYTPSSPGLFILQRRA